MMPTFTIQTSWVLKPAKIKVTIHDSIIDMQKATETEHTGGVCQRWYIYTKPLDGQTVAHIHLYKDALGGGIVSHEATHAATHIYKLKHQFDSLEDDDEPLAYTVGDIVSKIYRQLYKRGII